MMFQVLNLKEILTKLKDYKILKNTYITCKEHLIQCKKIPNIKNVLLDIYKIILKKNMDKKFKNKINFRSWNRIW